MGLDQYAFALPKRPEKPTDFEPFSDDAETEELFYWRKHPDLHGWMERLYRKKGGKAESFNCVTVELTSEDLDALEADMKAGALPLTRGFFFGESTDDKRARDWVFLEKARDAIAEGKAVFYDSWW